MTTRRTMRIPHSASPPKPTFTADDILAALEAATAERRDDMGVSLADIIAATGWPEHKAHSLLKRAVMAGTARCSGRSYRAAMDGTMRPVPVYAVVRAA